MKRSLQLALFAVVAIGAATAGYLSNRGAEPGTPAPLQAVARETIDALLALRLPDTEGEEQALAQWQGKIIVANFWATWCPPCRKEIPDFSAVSQAMANEPVQFVGISVDSADKVREFDAEFQVPYPLLIAGTPVLELAAGFGNNARALPFTVILDRDGTVRHIKLGTLHREELERKIRALLPS